MLNHATLTHPGNVRTVNEDTVAADPSRGLWLVADGMGGHAAGDVASQLVATTMLQEFALENPMDIAIERAHAAVSKEAISTQQADGMGSTLVAVCVKDDAADIAWVGDSRAYLWRNKHLQQITKDHSLVQELIDSGELSPEAAAYHPQSNVITQVLGIGDPEPSHKHLSLQSNDWLVLCSDGLWGELSDDLLAKVLRRSRTVQTAAERLVEQVRQGPGKDNVAVVILEYKDARHRLPWWPGSNLARFGLVAAAMIGSAVLLGRLFS